MKNTLNISKTNIATIVLAILLVSSTYIVFNAEAQVDTSKINIDDNALSDRLNPETGMPYGNLSQYEWRAAGADGENTRHTDGPVPNNPGILWSINQQASGIPSAFNGLVFVRYSSTVYAFNATTGDYAAGWPTNVAPYFVYDPHNATTKGTPRGAVGSGGAPGFGSNGAVVKVTDEIGSWLANNGPNFFFIDNGTVIPKPVIQGVGFTSFGTGGVGMYWGMMYSPEYQSYISVAQNSQTGKAIGLCIDCTDVLGNGAYLKWQIDIDTGIEALGFGGGMAFFGGLGEGRVFAIDMATGHQVWEGYKQGNAGYSATYYNGILYHSASSTEITAFDGATGAVVKAFSVIGARAFFVYGLAAQYGRVFMHSIETPLGWLGGWDAKTLEQQWRYPATYTIAYLCGVVGDRKFVCATSDLAQGSPVPGIGGAISPGRGFDAVDAFTGKGIWHIVTASDVLEPCLAYGNIYVQVGSTLICYSDLAAGTSSQQAGWPFFHGPVDVNGTSYGTATGNYPTNIKTAAWRFQAAQGVSGSVIGADGKVFFGSWSGDLYCLNAYTGTQIWSKHFNGRILSTPAYDNGTLYTGADDGSIYALNPNTGEVIWTTYAGGVNSEPIQAMTWQPFCSPIVYNSQYLVTGAGDGNLYCLNAKTGNLVWVSAVSNASIGFGSTSVAIHKDMLNRTCIYVMIGGLLRQINLLTGANVAAIKLGDAKSAVATPVIAWVPGFGDVLFVTYGAASAFGGSTAPMLVLRNATTLASLVNITLSKASGTTPATQTVTYVPSQYIKFADGTNLGYANSPAGNKGGPGVYRINQTGAETFMTLPCVYVAEATDTSCWAITWNQTTLGSGAGSVKLNYNGTMPIVNLTRAWNVWSGHQVLASAAVAINTANPMFPVCYMGNAAFALQCLNGSTGATLSVFSTNAQVFSTACLYDNGVYSACDDSYVSAFLSPQGVASIFAASDKGEQMLVNEQTVIAGKLTTTTYYQDPYVLTNTATFQGVEVPYAKVSLVWVNPDGTSSTTNTTTDAQGNFNFTYTANQGGKNQWLVFYDGFRPSDGAALSQAYSPYNTMNVVGGPSPTQSGNPQTSTPTPPITIDNTIIYAIVGIIVALVVIIAIVMLLRRKK